MYRENYICGTNDWTYVDDNVYTAEANTPLKCQEKVLEKCTNTKFFTWKSSDYSCQCVELDNCDNPDSLDGTDIYRIADGCGKSCLNIHISNN